MIIEFILVSIRTNKKHCFFNKDFIFAILNINIKYVSNLQKQHPKLVFSKYGKLEELKDVTSYLQVNKDGNFGCN